MLLTIGVVVADVDVREGGQAVDAGRAPTAAAARPAVCRSHDARQRSNAHTHTQTRERVCMPRRRALEGGTGRACLLAVGRCVFCVLCGVNTCLLYRRSSGITNAFAAPHAAHLRPPTADVIVPEYDEPRKIGSDVSLLQPGVRACSALKAWLLKLVVGCVVYALEGPQSCRRVKGLRGVRGRSGEGQAKEIDFRSGYPRRSPPLDS